MTNNQATIKRGAHAGVHTPRRNTRPTLSHAERAAMLADVLDGLGRSQKELSPKYFYDARGAALFDQITALPEYYLTRAERRLLARYARPWLQQMKAHTVIELGPGSGDKTRLLLDALPQSGVYMPFDISEAYLQRIAAELGAAYPQHAIEPVRGDLTQELPLRSLARPAVIAFLGSTIGNFTEAAACQLLRHVRLALCAEDRFLLGVDLQKDPAIIEAAYNDVAGVTASFNMNVLRVLNRELGADFDLNAFRHLAFYDEQQGRIEMHLVSHDDQTAHVGGHAVRFARGETVRTEISAKYSRDGIRGLFTSAGLELLDWVEDDAGYAITLAAPARAAAVKEHG